MQRCPLVRVVNIFVTLFPTQIYLSHSPHNKVFAHFLCSEKILSFFGRIRKIAGSDSWLRHFCPPVRIEQLASHCTDIQSDSK